MSELRPLEPYDLHEDRTMREPQHDDTVVIMPFAGERKFFGDIPVEQTEKVLRLVEEYANDADYKVIALDIEGFGGDYLGTLITHALHTVRDKSDKELIVRFSSDSTASLWNKLVKDHDNWPSIKVQDLRKSRLN